MSEEGETQNLSSRLKKFTKDAPFFCKIIEAILCAVSIGLIVTPFNDHMQKDFNHAGIVYVSICGFILINGILILCYLLGERMPKKMALMFSSAGAVLCCTAGLVLIHDWNNYQDNLISRYLQQYLDQMLWSGIFAILAAVVFAIDTFLIKKYE